MRLIIYTLLLLVAAACSPKVGPPLYSGIRYVEKSATADQVTVEIMGIAAKENQVLTNGAQKIWEAILYQGVPDSPVREPLIKNRNQAAQHQQFLTRLFNEQSAQFLTDAYLLAPPYKDKKTKEYSGLVRATVNLRSLKQALRSEGIIPRFGLK